MQLLSRGQTFVSLACARIHLNFWASWRAPLGNTNTPELNVCNTFGSIFHCNRLERYALCLQYLFVTFERCLRANNRNRTEIPKGITLLRPQETLVGQIAILNKSPLWCCFSMFSFFQEVFLLNITLSFSATGLWICGQFFLLFHWQAQTSKERQKSFFAAMLLDITRVRRW